MKKLLGLTFVAVFMMSMASSSTSILKGGDPFSDCDIMETVELMVHGNAIIAESVWLQCADEIIADIDFEITP